MLPVMRFPIALAIGLSLAFCLAPDARAQKGGGPASKAPSPLVVVDSAGKTMGRVIHLDVNLMIAEITASGVGYAAFYHPTPSPTPNGPRPDYGNLRFVSYTPLYFDGPNCTGQPYVNSNIVVGMPSTGMVIDNSNRTLLYPLTSQIPQGVSVMSAFVGKSDNVPAQCRTDVTGVMDPLFPVSTSPIDITGVYAPPFTVR